MILFGKLNWADMTTPWYKDELHKYEATDPYGIPYQQGGYSYVTPTQLAGINNRLDNLTTLSNKATTGVAMAFAMAGVPSLMPNESFAVTMNWGNFQNANGLALNAAVRLDNHVQLNGGVGYGANQNLVGGRVGLRFGW